MADKYGVFRTKDCERIKRAVHTVEGSPRTYVHIPKQTIRSSGGGGSGNADLTSTFWTIAEYDPATGDILRTFDRGYTRTRELSADLGLLLSSDGEHLYAAGASGIGADSGYLVKWNIDTGERVWESSDGSLNPAIPINVVANAVAGGHVDGMLCEADDGAIWMCRGGPHNNASQYVARFDPDTGAQTHDYGNVTGLGAQIFAASSGAVCVVSPNQSDIRRLSATATLTHTLSSLTTIIHVVDDGAGNLIVAYNGDRLRIVSKTDLSVTATLAGFAGNEVFQTVTSDGTTIWAMTGDGVGITYHVRSYDYTLTELSSTARDTSATTSRELKLDGGDLFDFAEVVREYNTSTGAETWQGPSGGAIGRRTATAIGSDFIASGHAGLTYTTATVPGNPMGLVCIERSSGTLRWFDNVQAQAVVVTDDDRLFVAHGRRGHQPASGQAAP